MTEDDQAERPRRRRWPVVWAAAVCTAVAVSAAIIWARATTEGDDPAANPAAVATVAITRTDLSTSRSLRGSLGFGAPRPVKSGREGVVTWLPQPGTTIGRGDVLFRIDDQAVPLFVGSPPLYRTLAARNTVGRDVAMVAANLKALGYAIGAQPKPGETVVQEATTSSASAPPTGPARVTVQAGDGVLTNSLIGAIKQWQKARGLPADGTLEVGDVTVLPAPVRVDSVASLVGDPATGTVMSVTPTTKVVTVQALAGDVGSLHEGDQATVRLPSGTELPATVGGVATVATQEGQQEQTVAVTITLLDPAAAGPLDGADVAVEIAGETHRGVLAVPVGALLALREGGYAVQLEDGRLLAVQTGLFSRGMVEVSGAGIAAGVKVVTTS
ncbi:efflux RND transporter periplasmic adaptor subunit [Dactylosporangium sp. McL0621]|uniref:efflux RND transporter periplasmic adaptor subunit n=1 Tax=Dactylosporangium sp. McL0621 TaxID=3415678 RepID=UPI003CF3C1DA